MPKLGEAPVRAWISGWSTGISGKAHLERVEIEFSAPSRIGEII
jgi:hypothetical protein